VKTTTLRSIKKELRIKDDTPLYYQKEEGKIIIMPYSEETILSIKKKMKSHAGLLPEEMEIAANIGLIERHQFANWTPERQREWREMEEEYKRGDFYSPFESAEEAKQFLKESSFDED